MAVSTLLYLSLVARLDMNEDYQKIQEYIARVLRADGLRVSSDRSGGIPDGQATVNGSNSRWQMSILAQYFPVSKYGQVEPDTYDGMETAVPLSEFTKGSPSGMPLGTHSRFKLWVDRYGGESDLIRLYARSKTVRVTIQIYSAVRNDDLGKKDLARAERIARLVFGEMSLEAAPTFNLRQIASAQGWTTRTNPDTTLRLMRGNEEILIPIGANRVKIGKQWVTLGGYFSVDRAPESFRPYLTRRR